jgi:hypothetical protein
LAALGQPEYGASHRIGGAPSTPNGPASNDEAERIGRRRFVVSRYGVGAMREKSSPDSRPPLSDVQNSVDAGTCGARHRQMEETEWLRGYSNFVRALSFIAFHESAEN